MREKPRDKPRLLHIIEAIDNIFEFIDDKSFETYKNDKILRFAVIKKLEIVGEAAYLLTKDFKLNHIEIEWNEMIGMRHILVHGYYQIKDEIIWATIETELLPLKRRYWHYSLIDCLSPQQQRAIPITQKPEIIGQGVVVEIHPMPVYKGGDE